METGVEGAGSVNGVPAVPRLPHGERPHGRPPDLGTGPDAESRALDEVVTELNAALRASSAHLTFTVDQDSGKTVVRVVDETSGEVIRQIPPEATLRLAAHIRDLMGLLLDENA